jgi:Bacterial Ig-like domain (group 3)/FG-GAP-like repeat/FG-GAP repeat
MMRHRLVSSLLFFSLAASTINANASGFQAVLSLNAGASPKVVLAGDFNGDGKADVVAVNNPGGGATGTVVTLLGNGDGTFQTGIVSASTDSLVAAAQGDFNKDGKLDIVVVDQQLQRAVLMLGNGTGGFTSSGTNNTCSVGLNPAGIVAADLNNDGKLDIAIVNQGTTGVAGVVTVCLGNGDGTFGGSSSYQAGAITVVATPDPVAIAAGDLNNDGKIDLVVALNSNAFSTLRGNGNGTFQAPSTQTLFNLTNPRAIAISDMNKDGNVDIVVTTSDVSVLLGNGDLTFDSPASYSVSGWLNGVSVADLNGDGQPDVITTNTFEHEICVLLNKGSGQLGPVVRYAVEAAPYSIAVADLNSDHSADVVVANNGIAGTGGSVTVAFGNGDGSLRAAYSYATNPPGIGSQSRAVVTGDFNNDGRTDIATLFAGDSVTILIADSKYSFQRLGTYVAGNYSGDQVVALAAADVNGDGDLDLVVVGLKQVDVLLGKGDGTFQSPKVRTITSGTTHGVALADVNGDGKVDLVYTWASAALDDIAVCFGDGDGTFQPPAFYTVGNYPYSVIAVDLNNDQKLDVVTANASGSLAYLKNNGDGTFAAAQPLTTGGYTSGVTAIDVNHDGNLDLVAMNSGNGDPTKGGLSFFLGHGDGTFDSAVQRLTGTTLSSVVSADFRNTGNGDVAVTGAETVFLFWGTQDGSVPSNPAKVSGGAFPVSIAAADLLAGGSSDIVLSQGSDSVLLLPNLGGTRPAVTPSANPSVYNQSVSFTAQFVPVLPWVGVPSGTVNYLEGTQLLGVAPVSSSGEATLPVSFTTVGAHQITAAYLGDGTFNARNVSAAQHVNQAPVDVVLVASPSSADPGKSITFTATLTPAYGGSPSGTVALAEGPNSLGSAPISGTGTAAFSISTLPVGVHSVVATYSGDTNYLTSTGSGQVIVRMTPTIALVSSTASAGAGWPVTLTATATGPLVTQAAGTISFMNGTTQVGSATTDSNGVAAFTTSSLPVGSLTITAVYVANQYSDSATSNPVALTITPDYTVSAAQTRATVRAGQSATYTLTVAGFGGFSAPISFSCSGQPQNSTCSFAPSSVTPSGSTSVTTVLTVKTAGNAAALKTMPGHRRSMILAFSVSFGLAGILVVGGSRNRRLWIAVLCCGIVALMLLTACGGGGSGGSNNPPPGPVTPSGSSTITVTATGAANGATIAHQISVTLVVNP